MQQLVNSISKRGARGKGTSMSPQEYIDYLIVLGAAVFGLAMIIAILSID